MRPVVYISGPISNPDKEREKQNVLIADDVFEHLMDQGFAAYCPHLTWYMKNQAKYNIDDWMENDLPLVGRSDAVLRIQPNRPSKGAAVECNFATEKGIPVFEAISDLKHWRDLIWPEVSERVNKKCWTPKEMPADALNPFCAFKRALNDILDMHLQKGKDYGTGEDPYNNLRAAEDYGLTPWLGCEIRLNDKQRRIQKFIREGNLANESVDDSLIDRAVYSVIAMVLKNEESSGHPTEITPAEAATEVKKVFVMQMD